MKESSVIRLSTNPSLPELEPRRLHLLYHELRESRSEYSYIVTTQEFATHLALVCAGEALHASLRPEFTFDDGHISDFAYALPLLAAEGVKASFFITVGWTGRRTGYMDWSELRALQQEGHAIGAHGWSHALLPRCSGAELDKELRGARLFLEDKLGSAIHSMSFPGGRYNKRVLKACQEAGYTTLYTSHPQLHVSGQIVGRVNVRGDMTTAYLKRLLDERSGALKNLGRQHAFKATLQRLLGDGLYASLWGLINRKEPDAGAGIDA